MLSADGSQETIADYLVTMGGDDCKITDDACYWRLLPDAEPTVHCFLCDVSFPFNRLQEHQRKDKHRNYRDWLRKYWNDVPMKRLIGKCIRDGISLWRLPHPIPITWGIEDMFKFDDDKCKYWCIWCRKNVDEKHITSLQHQDFIKDLGQTNGQCCNCCLDANSLNNAVDCVRCQRPLHPHCDSSWSGMFICKACCEIELKLRLRRPQGRVPVNTFSILARTL
jgi:hypothetical protein